MIVENYMETESPHMEVNQSFESKYLRGCAWKTAKILTVALSHQDLVNLS